MTEYPNIKIVKSEGLDWVIVEDCFLPEYQIVLKAGFVTDLVSSGRLFWVIIPPHGLSSNPAIVHDYVWRSSIFDRKTCDKVFLSLLKKSKVPTWQCYLMYSFVRVFGWMKNNKIK